MAKPAKTNARAETAVSHSLSTAAPTLSERQHDVLAFIVAYQGEHGQAPSVREIARELGSVSGKTCSTNWANQVVSALMRKGYLARRLGVARGLRVLRACPPREMSQQKLLNQRKGDA